MQATVLKKLGFEIRRQAMALVWWQKLSKKLGAIIRMAKTSRMMRLSERGLLSTGLYKAHPPALWVRIGETRNVSSHLRASKGRLGNSAIWVLVGAVVSPFLSFFVSGSKERTLAVVKTAHAADELLIFRTDHVFRVLGRPRTEKEIQLRRLWEKWISCSEEILEKSTVDGIAEKFVCLPTSANNALPESRKMAVSLIADAYFALSQHASMGKLADYRQFIEPKISASAYRHVISASFRLDALRNFWEQPLVPMASDNAPDNCLIGENSFAFIDTEPVRVGFAAQHVLGVIASWDQARCHRVLIDFLEGHFDDKMRQVLCSKVPLDRASRFGYIAMAVLLPSGAAVNHWEEFSWRDSLFEEYGLQEHIPHAWNPAVKALPPH